MKFRRVWGILPLLLVWAPNSASAQDKLDTGDTAWILISTGLVLFMMIPGLAMFYAGLVRTRNVLSVYMSCFGIAALITVLWTLFGYSLAFTAGNPFIGSLSKVFLSGVSPDSLSGTIPEPLFFVFQMTFAIITPGLIVGAFAERMKFSAVLWFSGLWCVLVYLPITHMVWGEGGYLGAMGVFDFAGGIVVHITAGAAALVAAILVGKRRRLSQAADAPAQHDHEPRRHGHALGWVVRFQWRQRPGGERAGRHGSRGHPDLPQRRSADLDFPRLDQKRETQCARFCHRGHRGDWRPLPRPRAQWGRSAPLPSACAPVW